MIKLNYQTNNPRWGLSGVKFSTWENYSFTLGYLCNISHYHNNPNSPNSGDISLHIEGNNLQGAWETEGRIHYYGDVLRLQTDFNDLYNCSSAGVGNITKRINSNEYILSLIKKFNFKQNNIQGNTTQYLLPPDNAQNQVKQTLKSHWSTQNFGNKDILTYLNKFNDGFNL